MISILKPIAGSLRTTNMVLPISLDDVKDEDARKRVRDGEGPSIAWHAGHVLEYRHKMLALIDGAEAEVFDCSGQDWDRAKFLTLWAEVDAKLTEAMEASTEEPFGRIVDRGVHGSQTILDKLVFLVWHEAFHIGGITSIRKELGYLAPAELLRARAAAR